MKIMIDLTSLSYHITGIERYAACVSEEMIKQDKKNEYILLFREDIYPDFVQYMDGKRIIGIIITGKNKLLFYQWTLYRALCQIRADRYIFFAYTSPIFFRSKGIVNTIHDMGAWDASKSLRLMQRLYWKITYRIAGRTSQSILTVSEFSKERIENILHFPANRIYVIPSAVYEGALDLTKTKYSEIRTKYSLPDKYIMSLSTLEPRKNIELLIQAYVAVMDRVDYDLVLVGRKGWKMDKTLKRYHMKSRIHITGYIPDADIAHIYRNAMCFVFPSLYEGFGLPPVEALALGTPVIASNAAAIPEVLRGQATYFENNSKEQLEKILLCLNNSLKSMPRELDDYQKQNYRFDVSAKRLLKII